MNDTISAFDITRMTFGDEPPLFLLEIAFRTVVIYVYTLVLIRWIGSRSISQLSLVEFLLVIALGSAVGDAMFYPDVPLVHCMLVITVVVLLDKALSYLVARHPKLEDVIEGKSVRLVQDGVIQCEALQAANFGHDELFEQLRLNGVTQLGEVRAAYLETNGMLSVFKAEKDKQWAGLSIDPPWDVEAPTKFRAGDMRDEAGTALVCARCGSVERQDGAVRQCSRCGGPIWHSLPEQQ
jgi:uncharacterized membrane protein YcaP (DUF421 family)